MRPEVHLAKRLSKIFCLGLVSWEQRIMMKTQSGSLNWKLHTEHVQVLPCTLILVLRKIRSKRKKRAKGGWSVGACVSSERIRLVIARSSARWISTAWFKSDKIFKRLSVWLWRSFLCVNCYKLAKDSVEPALLYWDRWSVKPLWRLCLDGLSFRGGCRIRLAFVSPCDQSS